MDANTWASIFLSNVKSSAADSSAFPPPAPAAPPADLGGDELEEWGAAEGEVEDLGDDAGGAAVRSS